MSYWPICIRFNPTCMFLVVFSLATLAVPVFARPPHANHGSHGRGGRVNVQIGLGYRSRTRL